MSNFLNIEWQIVLVHIWLWLHYMGNFQLDLIKINKIGDTKYNI